LTQTPSGLHCSYWWSLNDSDGLNDLLLVGLGTWTVEVTDDGGHTSLVAHGGSKVDRLLCVILWEAFAQKLSANARIPLEDCSPEGLLIDTYLFTLPL
jgi:hypothetical protein